MAIVKRLLCLANSRKLHGRCVAGIEIDGGQRSGWIRPVSARQHEEVSEYERQYRDGSDPRVLDIVDVPLLGARPKDYQRENWLLDPEEYWRKVGRASWSDTERLVDPPAPLWINGYSSRNGCNDRIPLAQSTQLTSSLCLVRVERLTLSVFRPGEAFGDLKRRVQGRFMHHGSEYRLWVTDPVYERDYLLKADGAYVVGESLLTVSLGEPYNDYCYKLVAAIIEKAKT
jgi:hypothetical protein